MSDNIVGLLPVMLVLGTLAIMASRTFAPVKVKPDGKVLMEMRLGFLQRALSQRANVIAVCAVIAVGGGAFGSQRVIPPALSFLALLVMLGMLSKRQTMVFTSRGVVLHNAAFRPWKDFEGYRFGGGKLVLRSATRLASVSLFFPKRSREDLETLVQRQIAPKQSNAASSRAVSRRRRTAG
jgi:hypothetical protein